jgi:hypothetical protein
MRGAVNLNRKAPVRKLKHLMIMALAATASLALLSASAAANRSLSASPAGTITGTSEGKITFEEPSGSFGIACSLTLNGTLERIAAKRIGAHVASVTEGRTSECRDTFFGIAGSAIALVEPRSPFDFVYQSFLGTLPRINGISVRADSRFLLRTAIGECLYSTTASREVTLLIEAAPETGAATRGHYERETTRLFTRLTGTCPASGVLAGRFRLTPTQTVRLL